MENKDKKVVLYHISNPLHNTGFSKHARNVFEYLHATNKYILVNLAIGSMEGNDQEIQRTPWKTIPTLQPKKIEVLKSQNDPKSWDDIGRMSSYGQFAIDDAIKEVRPDVYIASDDIWGVHYSVDKTWFPKISSIIWTTLDSRPILEQAVIAAKKTKNFWSWADFATKDMHKMGLTHVKTVRGSINTKNFFRLSDTKRFQLREQNNIDQDTFIAGFVFRNQLRKSVPNLLEGFKLFKQTNPTTKTKLLFHTSWAEGWPIPKISAEYGIPLSDILTTYVCKSCNKYEVKSFVTNEENCKYCGSEKSQLTTSPGFGVTEEQLNEIYNFMSVYVHPITSGGQEIPVQEAKLTELITLVTNYSCGEDLCQEGSGSLPLDWAEYREHGTNFIKSSTYPNSICKQLTKVLNMKPEARKVMGKQARQWVIDNFSIEKIGKILEDFIDAAPKITDMSVFDDEKFNPNPYYQVPEIKDDSEWILHLYHKILDRVKTDKEDDGYKHWMGRINKDLNREQIEQYFRQVAFQETQKNEALKIKFEDFLNKNDKGRVIVVQPEGAEEIYLLTSLFKSIKETYPDWSLYVSTKREFKTLIDGNAYVDKWLEYNVMFDNILFLEGSASHKGFFNIAYLPFQHQKLGSFHNSQDKISFNLNK